MRFAVVALLFAVKSVFAASFLTIEDCNFGDTYAFNIAQCTVTLRNAGDTTIRIRDFSPQTLHPDDRITPESVVVQPHSVAYVTATVHTGNDIGPSRHAFACSTDEGDQKSRAFATRGFVQNILDSGRPILNFGVVDTNAELPSQVFELHSLVDPALRAIKIKEVSSYLSASISSDGRSVRVGFHENAPWGYQGDYIKLETNSTLQKELWIGVQADVHGDVVPSTNPYSVGLLRTGMKHEIRIPITSRINKPFQIGKITLDSLKGSATAAACVPASEFCRELVLNISDEQARGSIIGKVKVALPDRKRELDIAVNGLLVEKDTKIEKLDAEAVNEGRVPGSSITKESALDLSRSLKQATSQTTDEAPSGNGPLIRWSAANEAALHGYQIFRGDSETGPVKLLNAEAVPIKAHDNSSSKYAYRDNTALSGNTYWYFIGLLYNDGHKQQLTGPQRVVAK